MNKHIITLLSSLLIAGSATTFAQDGPRGPGGNRGRPYFFALADKDKSGTVSLDELVNSRIEMMNRRGGQGQQQQRDPEEMAARIKEQMSALFKKADADEDGELSKEEFATMPQGRGPRGGSGGRGGQQGGPRGPRGDGA